MNDAAWRVVGWGTSCFVVVWTWVLIYMLTCDLLEVEKIDLIAPFVRARLLTERQARWLYLLWHLAMLLSWVYVLALALE